MLEVLAPIGSVKALKSAIYAGADAVYLGLDMFNARIKAGNFTKDNLRNYVELCHLFGVKVYITFNTSVKNSEMKLFAEYVEVAAKSKVDAFIVTDLGTLDIFKKYDIPLHASTQIGAHNLEGAKVLEDLGFTRVVLARETLLEDIIKIKKNTSLEIEYFVHGALCVCFSGSCLMSAMMSGDSGNRGRCNQPCRLKYSSSLNQEEMYYLSPKDQCLIDKISQLYQAGVDSLKIEGRLKQPHYVGNVVAQYRKAVDNIMQNKNEKLDYSALKRAYNRGNFTLGYNYENSKTIIFEKINGNIGEEVGEIVGCDKNIVKIKSKAELNNGDGVKIIKNGKELGGFCVDIVKRSNDIYYVCNNKRFEQGSKVCLTSEKSQIDKYDNIEPKLSIKFELKANIGEELELKAKYGNVEVKINGDIVSQAKSRCATKESVSEQLLRLGESDFTSSADDIEFVCDENRPSFIPLSVLNDLRRRAVEELRAKLIEDFENKRQIVSYEDSCCSEFGNDTRTISDALFVEIDGKEDDFVAISRLNNKVNVCLSFSEKLAKNIDIILKNDLIKNNIEKIFLKLPRVARGKDIELIEKYIEANINLIDGIIADNIYAIYLARRYPKLIVGGIGLNIYNSNYPKILGLNCAVNSVELNKNELIADALIYGFGRLAVMTLLHCPIQVNTNCNCSDCKYNGNFSYFDKRGEYKLERIKLKYCQFELYNQQIVDIRNKISQFNGNFYLDLRSLNQKDVEMIINNFVKKSGVSVDNSTYGHLFRGVK